MSDVLNDPTRTKPPEELTLSTPSPDPPGTLSAAPPTDRLGTLDLPAAPPPDVSAPSGYEILGELGRGGMGAVYKARQVNLNRVVALKVVPGGGRVAVARFWAEAEVVAAVRHPNVVQVYEFGESSGAPYMAMEFCPGGSLAERPKPLPPHEAAALVERIARGVAAAHSEGIVHRDLKPGNVLFDADGEPKVADFGLAKRTAVDLTNTHATMGTPAYMAPEQADGKAKFVGPTADVWALGVILYECATGVRPFAGADVWGVLHHVMTSDPAPARGVNPAVPRDLDVIVSKCLEKDPGRRYPTADALAADLRAFRDGRPIAARPVGRIERAAKWARRNPTQAALAAAACLGLVVGAAGWSSNRAKLRADRAAAAVERFLAADAAALPAIITELDGYGGEADPHLRRRLDPADPRAARRAALALLAHDPGQKDAVFEWLLDAAPDEFAVLVERLRPHSPELTPRLWAAIGDPELSHDSLLRVAAAAAQYDPTGPGWKGAAGRVVERLTAGDDLTGWARLFVPVRGHLRPRLDAAFAAEAADGRQWAVAATVAGLQPAPDWLFPLLRAASPQQIGLLVPALRRHPAAARAELELDLALVPPPHPGRTKEPLGDWGHNTTAPVHAARARAALALLHLGDHEPAWRLLRFAPDPQTRTYLIHWFQPSRFPLPGLLARFRSDPDTSARRALIQALGEYPPAAITPAERDRLGRELLAAFAEHPDPGIHSSAEWLLQRWGIPLPAVPGSRDPAPGRDWVVTPGGHTLAVVRGPLVVRRGTADSAEYGRESSDGSEAYRQYRLEHDFAIGTHEVTVAQFREFTREVNPDFIATKPGYGYSPEPECPVAHIYWHVAADYCRWLTTKEGLGEADQCYRAVSEWKPGESRAYPDALLRRGYRLPTEAEWEYACRAGTTASRYWGDDRGPVMRNYAVSLNFTQDRSFRVGQRKPNDLGLFDPLGNVWEWVHDSFGDGWCGWPPDDQNPDWGGPLRWESDEKGWAVGLVRGGSFTFSQIDTRAARRRKLTTGPPSYGDMGFRLARTLRPPAGGWELKLYTADYGPGADPTPPPGAWEKAVAGAPARVARAPGRLYFQYIPGGADGHFALVAERAFDGPAGAYDLTSAADDGARVFVDGKQVIDTWKAAGGYDATCRVSLQPGSALRVEYWQRAEFARLWVRIEPVAPPPAKP